MNTDPGYITINPAVAHGKFNVVVMKPSGDEYVVFRISQPLSALAAEALAKSWAAATRLEIRLMASTKKAPPIIEVSTDHVKVRTEGLQLIAPLAPAVRALKVTTPSQYLDADEMLGRIRNARSKWAAMMDPILAPLKRAEADIKLAKQGAKHLDAEVDGPLEQLEARVKEAMRQFKIEEARQLREAQEEEARQERERQAAIDAARRKEEAAKTAPMKAKLAEARAKLEAEQAAAEVETVDLNPVVKGASSAARTTRKIRITNLAALVSLMQPYEPKAGIYQMGVPPLSLISPEMLQVALNRLYREQPGVVESWPGVEAYDDIVIAGR